MVSEKEKEALKGELDETCVVIFNLIFMSLTCLTLLALGSWLREFLFISLGARLHLGPCYKFDQ